MSMLRRCGAVAMAGMFVAACDALGLGTPDVLDITQDEDITVGGGPTTERLTDDGMNTVGTGSGLSGSLSTELENQGVSKSDVDSVRLKAVKLRVIEPLREGQPLVKLNFIEQLSMYVGSPGLPEVLVAEGGQEFFASAGYSLDLPLKEGVDLKDYVTAESMSVRTEVNAHRPALSCTVRFTTALTVDVAPAGIMNRLPLPGR